MLRPDDGPIVFSPRPRAAVSRKRAPRKSRRLGFESLETRNLLAAFTAGNIAIYRVGDGTAALINTGNAVFIDEYSPSGSLVQSIPMPTATSGSNHRLIASGTATSEGLLTLSVDGRFLSMVGYDSALGGSTSLPSTTSAAVPRTVGLVSFSGGIDTTTALTDFVSGNNPRSAASDNGTNLWVGGAAGGVRYASLGGSTSTSVATAPANVRSVAIFNGQLYASSGSAGANQGVNSIGTGLPQTAGASGTLLPGLTGVTNNYQFALLDRDAGVAGVDTLYIADQSAGLMKFSFDGTTWTARGNVAGTLTGMTAVVNGANVDVYASSGTTAGNTLVKLTDSAAFNATISGSFSTLATAPTGTAFRGVAFAPSAGAANAAPVNTVPAAQTTATNTNLTFSTATSNAISIADPDAGTNTVQVQLTATNGTLTLSGTTGLSFSFSDTNGTGAGTGTANPTMTFRGKITDINTALAGLIFTPTTGFTGGATLTIVTNDLGNVGSGGAKTDTDSVSINVSSSQAPVVSTTASALSYTQNNSPIAIDTGLTVTDADSAQLAKATVSVTSGFVSGQDVLAFATIGAISGSYNATTGVLTLTGTDTVANYQAALRTVTYSIPITGAISAAARTISFVANDGALNSATATRTINITALNQPPVNTAPTTQATSKNATLLFSTATGNGISIADSDAGTSSSVQVTLTATNGTLTLVGTTGLSFSFSDANGTGAGTGTNDATMTFRGTLTNINNALNGLLFTPTSGFSGAASLQIVANDLGNTGVGGAKTATSTVAISVSGSFTAGDLVVLTVGDGVTGLGSAALPVTLREFSTTGTAVQNVPAPIAQVGSNAQLTLSGSASSEGGLALSANGQYLVFGGYGANVGTTNVVGTTATAVNRVIGRVDATGIVDTSTRISDGYDTNNFRSVASADGTNFYTGGTGTGGGTRLVPFGNPAATPTTLVSSAPTTTRVVEIYNGQLYVSAASGSNTGINTVGTGLPTGTTSTTTLIAGLAPANAYAFTFLDRNAGVAGLDTLYVADQASGLLKFSFDGTNWTAQGSVAGQLTGLTAVINGSNVDIYATNGTGVANTLVKFTDTAAFNATITAGSFTTLATAAANTAFRGVAFAPQLANQPPVLDLNGAAAGTGFTANFTEKGSAVAIVDNANLSLTDADTANMASATVTISNLLDGTSELLAANVAGTSITASYNSGTGVLTLSGSDTVAHYQSVLRTVTYSNGSLNPTTTARTVNFVVNDGASNSTTAVSTVSITAVNDQPVLDLNGAAAGTGFNANFVVGGGAVAIVDAANLALTDVDNANMASATVAISNRLDGTNEVLSATSTGNISVNYNSGTGTLTLSGSDTVANYQTVLRSVRYNNTLASPNLTTRVINFVVNDGTANSSTVSSNVALAPNQAPVLDLNGASAGTGFSAAFTEAGGAVAIVDSANLTLTDADSPNMASATVTISNLLNGTSEVLSATATGNITVGYNSATGVFTLSGSDTVANYQTVLRSVRYNNTSQNPTTTARTINFVVNDGIGNSNTAVSTVSLTAVNDPPALDLDTGTAGTGATATFTEAGGAVAIVGTTTLSLTDPDNTNMASATVTISNRLDGTSETLSATATGSITVNYNSATGVLTLSGSDTVANYQTVLRSVKYNNTSQNPNTTARTINFVVSDGSTNSNTAVSTVTVVAVNNPPALDLDSVAAGTGFAATFTEAGGAVAIVNATNLALSDVDNTTMASATVTVSNQLDGTSEALSATATGSITVGYNSATGVLTLSGSDTVANYQTVLRSVKYNNTSLNPTTTARTINFVVNDGTSNSNTAVSTVTVVAVNTTPVNSVPAAQTTALNSPKVFSTLNGNLVSISDVDAGSSNVQVTLTGTNGTVSLSGTAGLSFSFSDANGTGAGTGTNNATMTFRGTISAINTALSGMSFSPSTGFSGGASLQIVTNDLGNTGSGGTQTASDTISITVTASANQPAVITTTATALAYSEGDGAKALDSGLTLTDVDGNTIANASVSFTAGFVSGEDVLAFSNTAQITGNFNSGTGVLTLSGATTVANYQAALRSITYQNTSVNPSTATRTLSFVANDTVVNSSPATRNIAVTSVNNAPLIAVPAPQTTNEDATLVFSSAGANAISATDIDAGSGLMLATLSVNNGKLTLGSTSGVNVTAGANNSASLTFTATLANLNTALAGLAYQPTGDYFGNDTLSISVSDQGNTGTPGALTDAKTVTISINPVNDAPSFTKGADVSVDVSSGAQTVAGWATNISPGPGNESTQTVSFTVSNNNNAIFTSQPTIAPNGTLTFTPSATAGTATVSVSLKDSGGTTFGGVDTSAVQTFFINVLPSYFTVSGSTLTGTATASVDTLSIQFFSPTMFTAIIDGQARSYSTAQITNIVLNAAGGNDVATIIGTGQANESLTVAPGLARFLGPGYTVTVNNAETIQAFGQMGDSAVFTDSAGTDTFYLQPQASVMFGSTYYHQATGFGVVAGSSTAGNSDVAIFYDTSGNDSFTATPPVGSTSATAYMLASTGQTYQANGFRSVFAFAFAGGSDTAYISGSTGNDTYVGTPTLSYLVGSTFAESVYNFDTVNAQGGGGLDVAYFYDSAGDDTFTSTSTWSQMTGPGYSNFAAGFYLNIAVASQGKDTANLYGAGNGGEYLYAKGSSAQLTSTSYGYVASVTGFDRVGTRVKGRGNSGETANINAIDFVFFSLG